MGDRLAWMPMQPERPMTLQVPSTAALGLATSCVRISSGILIAGLWARVMALYAGAAFSTRAGCHLLCGPTRSGQKDAHVHGPPANHTHVLAACSLTVDCLMGAVLRAETWDSGLPITEVKTPTILIQVGDFICV